MSFQSTGLMRSRLTPISLMRRSNAPSSLPASSPLSISCSNRLYRPHGPLLLPRSLW